MGIQGTEISRKRARISVIMDDNFSSVATVLRWGRCVYENIQKFIQFQLTVNVAALVINFVAAISAGEVLLTAVQLLWVNLIMDTLGALALATEKPTKELMKKKPVGRTEPLITNIMWRNLLPQAHLPDCNPPDIAVQGKIDLRRGGQGEGHTDLQHICDVPGVQ